MIKKDTIDKVRDAAQIYDVVSDFVSLKRRGQSYVGLCPFHNDRNPSFYVTPSRNYCKCFSCGEGADPIGFLRKHQQMTFEEAIRYLANKYNIEIEEQTNEDPGIGRLREALFITNEFALSFFEKQLHETTEGNEVGMSYFLERGMNMVSIKKFHLGYSPSQRDALYKAATKAGLNREHLFLLGLCYDDKHGGGFDAYRDRVIFPIFNKAGKVVGFGGRTLKNDNRKYINSPDNLIYNKSKEMYGLMQAKKAISKQNKAFIVEGYFDVISMHQAGFENVIATSGTALTTQHVRSIRLLTENITELFDGDSAGIKAAVKGLDRLLKDGMKTRVLILPEPEDPDSYARSHSSTEISNYISEKEEDGIFFLTNILLKECAKDPLKRATAITRVLKTVALIPDEITRQVYAGECSRKLGLEFSTLQKQIEQYRTQILEEDRKEYQRELERKKREQEQADSGINSIDEDTANSPSAETAPAIQAPLTQTIDIDSIVGKNPHEDDVIIYVIKYGACYFCDTSDENSIEKTSLCEWVDNEMKADGMQFSHPLYTKIMSLCMSLIKKFNAEWPDYKASIEQKRAKMYQAGIEKFKADSIASLDEIEKKEQDLQASINAQLCVEVEEYRKHYIERYVMSDPDITIGNFFIKYVADKHILSKIHTEFSPMASDYDRLTTIIPEILCSWKLSILQSQIVELKNQLSNERDYNRITEIMKLLQEKENQRLSFSRFTGERVITPNMK